MGLDHADSHAGGGGGESFHEAAMWLLMYSCLALLSASQSQTGMCALYAHTHVRELTATHLREPAFSDAGNSAARIILPYGTMR